MLIGFDRPTGVTWTISGTGATMGANTANLDDGRPDTLNSFTWLTGTQTTASVLKIRGDWTSGAIIPRIVGLSNISLPAGVKVKCAFRRSSDTVGTYPYTPTMLATTQPIFEGPRGELTAWLMPAAGADPVVGVEFQIYNDDGVGIPIPASYPFTIGEAAVGGGADVSLAIGPGQPYNDPTTQNWSWNNQPYASPGLPYRSLTAKLVTTTQGSVFGDPALPSALDSETLLGKIDRGRRCVYVLFYRTMDGAFSPHLLHRTALIGVATRLPTIQQVEGAIFSSGELTIVESPIPV